MTDDDRQAIESRSTKGTVREFSGTLQALLANVSNTGRGRKQILSATADAAVSLLALWAGLSVRLDRPFVDIAGTWYVFLFVPAATVTIFAALGIYRWVVRSSNRRLYRQLVKGCVLSAFALVLLTFLFPPPINPRSLFGIYGVLLVAGTAGLRVAWRSRFDAAASGEPVAIYGAGEAGRQLVSMLGQNPRYRPVAFIDDDPTLRGTTVSGLPVFRRDEGLKARLTAVDVGSLILAIPSLGASGYGRLLERVAPLELSVRTIPAINELVTGAARADEIRDVSIGDLLGRAEVAPNPDLLGRRVTARTVLVSGGGGSIGSEVCRQIVRLAPRRLIVLDSCEANLYHIGEELAAEDVDYRPHLASVNDRAGLDRLMSEHAVDTVYHAAAYKHVPIIERQPEQGVVTNVFGTLALLEASIAHGVSDFVLISTDKAVRPANAMGASKRVAEMVLQAQADRLSSAATLATRISMVRFGNVLGSSGSVVPKFARQIEEGGPVTITDPAITRFFMTIPEAAQLVLQASAVAKGGDVFVLDMGEPVRIMDLARTMVRLHGKGLRAETGDPADIEIRVDGLRPGEKMFEELFITDEHRSTAVPKVFTADEDFLPWEVLRTRLASLSAAIERNDREGLRDALMQLVDEPEARSETRLRPAAMETEPAA